MNRQIIGFISQSQRLGVQAGLSDMGMSHSLKLRRLASQVVVALVMTIGLSCTQVVAEEYIGIVKPRRVILVGSSVQGVVEYVPVERGARVKKGELLAQLNKEVEEVELSLSITRNQLAKARYQRQEKLDEKDFASEEEVESSRIQMELSSLEVKRYRLMLKKKKITSPINGVVTKRLVEPGEYVYDQVPVMEVAQIHPLNVELLVPVSEYGYIVKGMATEVLLDIPGALPLKAHVEVVNEVMNAASGTFGVRLKLPNPNFKIPAGVKCSVKFLSTQSSKQKLNGSSTVVSPKL